MEILERFRNMWEKIKESPARLPSTVTIPRNRVVDTGESLGEVFRRETHYFQVRVNEMYLTRGRKWYSAIDPMVFVVSEFTYGNKVEAVPFVVGPMMMERYRQEIPEGMIFSDTRVAGLHPYKGGGFNLSVILYEVQRENYAQKLMNLIETSANAFGFPSSLGNYLKIADVVLSGVDALFGLGKSNPVIGFRKEFDSQSFAPSYFALINKPEEELDKDQLWVVKNKLHSGETEASARMQPYRDADYVLYSITQRKDRDDLTTLPFYTVYDGVLRKAMESTTEDLWKATKAEMLTLAQAMRFSPDLTVGHYDQLRNTFVAELVKEHERAVQASTLGKGPVDEGLKKVVDILNL